MSTGSNDESGSSDIDMARNIVALHARCDALSVLVLGKQLGGDTDKLREVLETVRATSYHKWLETIEDRSPTMAARLDGRDDLSHVDWELLKHLRFHS